MEEEKENKNNIIIDNNIKTENISKEQQYNNLKKFSTNYAQYFQFHEIHFKNVNNVNESVESMLTQIDELSALVESVRLNIETTKTLVPSLLENAKELEKTFILIDSLEIFIQNMEEMIKKAEDKVYQIEQQISFPLIQSLSNVTKKVFHSWLGKKKTTKDKDIENLSSSTITTTTTLSSSSSSSSSFLEIIDTQQYLTTLKSDISQKLLQ